MVMETAELTLRGGDPEWVATASRDDLFDALAEAAGAQRVVDAAVTACRAELRRRTDAGCGRNAADEIEVRRRTGESTATARRQQRRAELVRKCPAAADGLQDGDIGGDHLDAVTTVVPAEMADAVEADQDALFQRAAVQTPDEFRASLREWVEDVERKRGIDRAARQRRRRNGRIRTDPRTGMTELHAELPPLQGATVAAHIRAEYRRLLAEDQTDDAARTTLQRRAEDQTDDATRTTVQRWADAITHVVLSSSTNRTVDDRLPVVIVDSDVLGDQDVGNGAGRNGGGQCRIHGSEPIEIETAHRFICDSPVTVITKRHGTPVAIDTVARRASTAQRRALATMYDSCARPGCEVPFDDCHVHHIHPWATTHTTELTDLIPVCTTDHHLVHEGGWQLQRTPDWTDTWTGPTGHTLTHHPQRGPGPPPGPAP